MRRIKEDIEGRKHAGQSKASRLRRAMKEEGKGEPDTNVAYRGPGGDVLESAAP